MSYWNSFSHKNYLGGYQQTLSNLFDLEHNDQRQGFPNKRLGEHTLGEPPKHYGENTRGEPLKRYRESTLGEPPNRYGESTLGETPKRYGQSTLGEPPNRYGESTLGETPKRYGQITLGEPPKRYRESPLGEPPNHHGESTLGEPPKRYRESTLGEPPNHGESTLGEPLKRSGESIFGEPPKHYGEFIFGEPPERYRESLLEEPLMHYRGSLLGESSKLFDRRPNQDRSRPNQDTFDSEPYRNERFSSQESQRQVQGSLTNLFDIPSDKSQQRIPLNNFDQEWSSGSQRSDFRNKKPRGYNKPQYDDDVTNYKESRISSDTEFLQKRFEPLQGRSFGSGCMMQDRDMENSNLTRGQSTHNNWRNQDLCQGRNSSQPRSNFKPSRKFNTKNSFYALEQNTKREFNFNNKSQQGKQTFKVEDSNKKPHELSVQIKDNQLQEQNVKMEHPLIEFNGVEDEEGWEEEARDSDEEYEMDACETSIPFTLDSALVEKYREYPPEPEELGKIFEGLVIYFFYKNKSVKEKNPFVLICESFRRSNKFGCVQVEDGYQKEDKTVKFCTIRLNGMMLVRAAGLSGNLKEPRVRAGVDLINRLAMTCYMLKMKGDYYSNEAMRRHLKIKESPGLFKVVPEDEVRTLDKAIEYMKKFFSEDTDCELIFTNHFCGVLSYAKENGLDFRKPNNCMVVFKKRSTIYWRDKILASGKMENEKFVLVEPQGIGRILFPKFDYASVIPKLKNYLQNDCSVPNFNMYGPKGTIPTIVKITVPWEKKNTRGKSGSRNKERKIMEALKQGLTLNQIASFRHMNHRLKKRIKHKLFISKFRK